MEASKNNIRMRQAVPEDAEGIVLAHEASWLSAYCSTSYGVTEEKIKRWFANKVNRIQRWENRIRLLDWKTSAVWVAEDQDSTVLGFIAPKIELEKARVGAIYLRPEAQGKGIGSVLLNKVKDFFPQQPIYLDVVTYNTGAIEFYKKHGFISTGKQNTFSIEQEGKVFIEMPVEEYVYTSNTKDRQLL